MSFDDEPIKHNYGTSEGYERSAEGDCNGHETFTHCETDLTVCGLCGRGEIELLEKCDAKGGS